MPKPYPLFSTQISHYYGLMEIMSSLKCCDRCEDIEALGRAVLNSKQIPNGSGGASF
ncbi:MAG: hypothetical protein ACLSA6_06460 [Holdemania massiliensis]